MSNSPQVGQACCASSPYIQSAGQTPQPVGTWSTVATNRPELKVAWDSMRTERRLSPSKTGPLSTPTKTLLGVALTMPALAASSKLTYRTLPPVGSGFVKKSQEVKKSGPR
eukprot:CAMPEP_0172735714 /NCGR_PEP_ID=MMETSP1074-20121228/113150_1 /TAXON_ID=2916 /ORGANISM="Ceratium fusus, Strain PA161109" /LENGTH=110 /DNA_ID=CAMNT_0013564771 /DNA_START=776 /DNA_END=1108 /DNA_ORIENTATION=+